MDELRIIKQAVIEGNKEKVMVALKDAIEKDISISSILNEGLIEGMTTVGELWIKDEIWMPEVLVSANAMKSGMELILPALKAEGVKPKGKVILGTVKSDIHDIGKNLVGMMMLGAGFEVIDLGIDIGEEVFIEAIRTEKPDIIALSALLTTTIKQLEVVIKAVEDAGLRSDVKIMVGGAPVTQSYAEKIGADGYAPDAASAAKKALELIGE
jgi:5-methyltetrahydrofolate--homocysteine methyltransferase